MRLSRKNKLVISSLFSFFIFFPALCFANAIQIPKDWVVKNYAPQQEYIFKNPKLPESIILKKMYGFHHSALAVLRGTTSQLARIYPDFRYLAIYANPSHTLAECEMMWYDPKFKYQEHETWFVELKHGKGFLLTLDVKNALFPYVEGWYNEIADNLFHARIPQTQVPRPEAASLYLNKQTWEQPIDLSRVKLTTINAGEFWMQIPAFWRVVSASPRSFHLEVQGNAGESFTVNSFSVAANEQTLQNELTGLRAMGAPPQVLELRSRLLAPYLSPVQVVQYLFPKVASGLAQNLKVLGSSNAREFQQDGDLIESSVVTYEYQKIMGGKAVPEEGAAEIITVRLPFITALDYTWKLIYIGAEAPPWVFQKEIPLFMAMAHSIRINNQAILQNSQNNRALGNEIANFGEQSIQGFQNSENLIASTGQRVMSMQYNSWKNGYSGMMHNTYGWMEAYTGEQPYVDTNTGQKVMLQGYGLPGEKVRAYENTPYGIGQGDVLRPVPLGTF